MGEDGLRAWFINEKKWLKPTFKELFSSFVTRYQKAYRDTVINHKITDEFSCYDYKSLALFDILNAIDHMDTKTFKELEKWVEDHNLHK